MATRYLLRHYCTVDPAEVARLSALDRPAGQSPRATDNVELVHVDTCNYWAWWSDEKLTTSIGLTGGARSVLDNRPAAPPPPAGLPVAAARLISACRGSDSGTPTAVGGYPVLSRVVSAVTAEEEGGPARSGGYARRRIERLDVRFGDGTTTQWWAVSDGYPEGYTYELFPTRTAAADVFGELAGNDQAPEAWAAQERRVRDAIAQEERP